jgi:outer membrane biosynthesis protein TonB
VTHHQRGAPGRHAARGAATLALWLALAASSACARASAKVVDVPLETPTPPPRTVEVIDPETPAIVTLPEEPVPSAPSRARPAPAPRADTRPPEPPRPEPPAEPVRPADEERINAPTLQPAGIAQDREVERRVRMLVSQAIGNLGRVDYRALDVDGRTQYDTAKRFISQAEEAVRTRNYVFASSLADKAAALAAVLAGR